MPLQQVCELCHWTYTCCSTTDMQRSARLWHWVMGYTDKAGRPIKYYYHTHHERLVTKQSVHNEEETMDDSYPWVAYAVNGEDKAEFTVKLRPMQTRHDHDDHIRPCPNCIDDIVERNIHVNIRPPPTTQQPSLIEEMAEFHMAVIYNRGERITFEAALEYVKTKHPRVIEYMKTLSYSTEKTVHALEARINRLQRELAEAEEDLYKLRFDEDSDD